MEEEKYRIIDAHCHIFPERIAEKAVKGTDDFYGLSSFGKGTFKDLLAVGAKDGVDGFVVHSVATSPRQVETINTFIAEEVALCPEKLLGLGALHPHSSDILGDIEQIEALGLEGVKLHPDIQNFKADDQLCADIYSICEKKGLPVLIHAGDSRYDRSNPNRLYPVLQSYPRLKMIAAHLGGWSVWDDVLCLMDFPNLYVDTCSSFPFLEQERAKELIEGFGFSKVLFGTDYPMWRAKEEIAYLLRLGFSVENNRKIFSENIKNIFPKSALASLSVQN
ncbi:MAG: amidohydrolase [Clostridia bacterium]|nr:amidohydrolase [Clostridia bacterium]